MLVVIHIIENIINNNDVKLQYPLPPHQIVVDSDLSLPTHTYTDTLQTNELYINENSKK